MTSSKTNIELLVRVGVLEKLVDKLMDKIDRMEANLNKMEALGLTGQVNQGAQEVVDDWDIRPTEELEKDPKKIIKPGDEVKTLLEN